MREKVGCIEMLQGASKTSTPNYVESPGGYTSKQHLVSRTLLFTKDLLQITLSVRNVCPYVLRFLYSANSFLLELKEVGLKRELENVILSSGSVKLPVK